MTTTSHSDHEQMQRFLEVAHAALPHWGLQDAEIQLVARRENAVYRVTRGASRYALRIHRPGYHDADELRSELVWMQVLAEHGIRTPTVVDTTAGAPFAEVTAPGVPQVHLCDLLGWVEGSPLGSADDATTLGGVDIRATYETVGRMAADMHRVTREWPRPAFFRRHSWEAEGCLGASALWGRYGDLQSLSAPERDTLDRAVALVRQELQAYGQGPDRYGLIHADFVPDNLIASPAGVVVLDFDDSGFGWHLWELVTAVFWYIETPHFDAALQGYRQGYLAARPLSAQEQQLLLPFFLMRALVYQGWMHTRRGQPTALKLTEHVKALSLRLAGMLLRGERTVEGVLGRAA